MAYEYDAGVDRRRPDAVVFPTRKEQVVEVVKLAGAEGVPFVARGAGTNLSGGSIPAKGGLIVEFARMNRILELDIPNQRAVVEPGVINLDLNAALAEHGYFYAPDPASQKVSTMGGNVGENSGGPHCLKYGVTTNHVLGLEVVLPDGELARFGGKAFDAPGYDLTGLFVGSEGMFGLVTEITVRILRQPEAVKTLLAVFNTIEDAADSVSAIIARGILPATLEMMDKAVMEVVEASFHCGYPLDAEAVLIAEVDGLRDGLERLAESITEICRAHRAREVRAAKDAAEAAQLWAGRRGAFGAIARLSPGYLTMDGTVPRTELPRVLRGSLAIGRKYGLRAANVFHAGDGNLHPLLLFDERDPAQAEAAHLAAMEILALCASAGGTITGEHGVGLEKRAAMPLVFSEADLDAQKKVRAAFDPTGLCNPGKMFPD
ncbi:MAG: FAD-binding protein [Planctomycetes bacterium]|nr:FAD-binding protein [Planctomycetota bacterium]